MDETWYEQEGDDLFGYGYAEGTYYDPELEQEASDAEGVYYGIDPEMAEAKGDPRTRAKRLAMARARRRAAARAARLTRGRGRQLQPIRRPYPSGAPMRAASTVQVSQGFQRVGADVLETKVQSDVLGTALAAQNKRIGRAEYSIAASKVADIAASQVAAISGNAFLKTALPLAPLALLLPARRGSGLESFISDPRVWGIAGAAGLALFNHFQGKVEEPAEVRITPDRLALPTGGQTQVQALARDRIGNLVAGRTFTFKSTDDTVADVDSTGSVTAKQIGEATIIATDPPTNLSGTATVVVTR